VWTTALDHIAGQDVFVVPGDHIAAFALDTCTRYFWNIHVVLWLKRLVTRPLEGYHLLLLLLET
jgi:hypothetical protein